MPSTSTSGPPIMKSVCTVESLQPSSSSSSVRRVAARATAVVDPLAVGDVAGRVLVEERVEEDEPGVADARVAVDERDLAEERRALVGARSRSRTTSAPFVAFTSTTSPALEPQRRGRARSGRCSGERHRRADDALRAQPVRRVVNTSSVGMFDDLVDRRHGLARPRQPQRARAIRPTVRSVPGPRKRIASKRRSLSTRGARLQPRRCARATRRPGRARRAASRSRPPPRAARRRARRRPPAPSPRSGSRRSSTRSGRLAVAASDALGDAAAAAPSRCAAGSRSAKSSGSGSPVIEIIAPFVLGQLVDERERPRRRPVERVLRGVPRSGRAGRADRR